MAEQPTSICPSAVPDYGPVTPDCPVDCLRPVLPLQTLNLLARAYGAPFDPPCTIGEVVGLYRDGRLREIGGLGRRRISEIEVALVFAGLDITAGARDPLDAGGPGKAGDAP